MARELHRIRSPRRLDGEAIRECASAQQLRPPARTVWRQHCVLRPGALELAFCVLLSCVPRRFRVAVARFPAGVFHMALPGSPPVARALGPFPAVVWGGAFAHARSPASGGAPASQGGRRTSCLTLGVTRIGASWIAHGFGAPSARGPDVAQEVGSVTAPGRVWMDVGGEAGFQDRVADIWDR